MGANCATFRLNNLLFHNAFKLFVKPLSAS